MFSSIFKTIFFVVKSEWLALKSNVSLGQGFKNFSKISGNHLRILGAKMIMKHKFHTENHSDKNLVAMAPPRLPEIAEPLDLVSLRNYISRISSNFVWQWGASSPLLFTGGKIASIVISKWSFGTHFRSRRDSGENYILSSRNRTWIFGHPANTAVTTLTELPCLWIRSCFGTRPQTRTG